jgi:hypothetical protein
MDFLNATPLATHATIIHSKHNEDSKEQEQKIYEDNF